MADELQGDITLDITDALARIEELRTALESALTDSATSFSDAFSTAVTGLPPLEVDTSAVAPSIDEAIASSNAPVDVQVDASAVGPEIDNAVANADPAPVPIEADTSGAVEAVGQLGDAATGATSQVAGLGDSTKLLEGGAALAVGEVGGLRGVVAGLGATSLPAVAGTAALATGIGVLVQKGIQGTAAQQRYNAILGEFADQVDHVQVGNLNTTISKLSIELGTVPSKTQQAAASLFQMGTNAGIAAPQVAKTTDEIIALAARSVALKPSLGDVGDVADAMSVRLGRGGVFATRLGISLTATEIAAEAARLGLVGVDGQLSSYEKTVAAASLATEKYGGSLSESIAKGSQNAEIQQRKFRAELETTLEDLAKPLVGPFFSVLQSGLPGIEAFGKVLGVLAQSALPALATTLSAVVPVLGATATIITVLGPAITPALLGFLAFKAVAFLPALLTLLGSGFALVGAESAAAAVDIAAADIALDANPIGAAVAVVVAAAAAFGLFGSSTKEAATDVNAFSQASDGMLQKLAETFAALQESAPWYDAHGAALKQLTDLSLQNAGAAQRWGAALVDAGVLKQGEVNTTLEAGIQAQRQSAADTKKNTDAVDGQATAYDRAKSAADAYKTSLDRLTGANLDQFSAQSAAASASDALATALKDGKGSFDLRTDAGRKDADALIASTKAAQDLAVTTERLNPGVGAGAAVMTFFEASLRSMLSAAGLAPGVIDGLISRLGLVTPAAQGAVAGIQQIPDSVPPALRSAEERMLTGGSALASTASSAGSQAGHALGAGFSPAAKTAIESGHALANATLSSLARLILNGTAFNGGYGAGQLLSSGLAQGISSNTAVVQAAAVAVVHAAIYAARHAGSPSEHLFYDAGASFIGALADGALAGREDVAAVFMQSVKAAAALPLPPTGAAPPPSITMPGGTTSAPAAGDTGGGGRGPLIGQQNFYGMDPASAARAMSREAAWVDAMARS